jgi:hypothetical protein
LPAAINSPDSLAPDSECHGQDRGYASRIPDVVHRPEITALAGLAKLLMVIKDVPVASLEYFRAADSESVRVWHDVICDVFYTP